MKRRVFTSPFFFVLYLFILLLLRFFEMEGRSILNAPATGWTPISVKKKWAEADTHTHTTRGFTIYYHYATTTRVLSFFLSFFLESDKSKSQSVVCCRSEWPLVTLTPLLHHQHPIRLLLLLLFLPLQQQRNSGGWECAVLKLIIYILQSVFSIIRRAIFHALKNKKKNKQLKSIWTWKCVVQSCLVSLSSCPSCWLSSHTVQQVNQKQNLRDNFLPKSRNAHAFLIEKVRVAVCCKVSFGYRAAPPLIFRGEVGGWPKRRRREK
jgi:hypothetical protein